MKYAEIKEKMTREEWRVEHQGKMGTNCPELITIVPDSNKDAVLQIYWHKGLRPEDIPNAHAIVTAVNNTYVKGIDPEAVPIMKTALEEWKRQIEKVISWGNAFLGEKFDEKMQRNLLKQCEQALAAARGTNG